MRHMVRTGSGPPGGRQAGIAEHVPRGTDRRLGVLVEQEAEAPAGASQQLGRILAARAPDVAFVREDRLDFDGTRFAPLAPDLAVEVLSPSNTVSEIHDKVLDYLEAGTRLVWVVDPASRTVTVYRSRDEIRLLRADDEIDGADVLPGFHRRVAELFGS